ncbi:alpha/beta-type small acid-soluble spore protein [Fictibacillus nanhaiensis]|jgi:small acid-soluble spore protein D (minor alpha/beta-type SASP)|uniref:alpha/beta-type small acid-soluble spore protein n=1 Tax=Fictibacillus nanhaiensis TaxID=742169 RepID=UPI00203E6EDE|nr:alpha/beta-type small acid-soluble spore protein [Fictibacillus nanhaiensis]MCM3730797.1 alpha/beta-type small acid-soluble spore protein [Fictibacillus nanhaiensis]
MARRKRQPIVPEAREGLDKLKAKVMREAGYNVSEKSPDDVKYEVAKDMGVSLEKGYNGKITSKDAGRVGGQIGGRMVKELIQQAKANLGKQAR